MLKLLLRYNLLWIILILIFLPGILFLFNSIFGESWEPLIFTPNFSLSGITQSPVRIAWNFNTVTSHNFQKYIDLSVTNNLPLRSLLIRTSNTIYYYIFKKSYAGNGSLVIGKSNQLLDKEYIYGYCSLTAGYNNTTNLKNWADKVKELNTFFTHRGQLFIYLITPSKAEYMPGAIPNRFHCENRGQLGAPHELYLEHLLEQRNVPVVNEVTAMFIAKNKYHSPMFPQGGTHWNQLGATIGANALIDTINKNQSIHINPLNFQFIMNHHPTGTDTDLLNLLNILSPHLDYPVPLVTYIKTSSPRYKIVFIGGSFIDRLADVFIKSNTFDHIMTFNYFKVALYNYVNGLMKITLNPNVNSNKVLTPILDANIVVLEENASLTISNHGNLFYQVIMKYAKKTL